MQWRGGVLSACHCWRCMAATFYFCLGWKGGSVQTPLLKAGILFSPSTHRGEKVLTYQTLTTFAKTQVPSYRIIPTFHHPFFLRLVQKFISITRVTDSFYTCTHKGITSNTYESLFIGTVVVGLMLNRYKVQYVYCQQVS